jgi:hypothetical protein
MILTDELERMCKKDFVAYFYVHHQHLLRSLTTVRLSEKYLRKCYKRDQHMDDLKTESTLIKIINYRKKLIRQINRM